MNNNSIVDKNKYNLKTQMPLESSGKFLRIYEKMTIHQQKMLSKTRKVLKCQGTGALKLLLCLSKNTV